MGEPSLFVGNYDNAIRVHNIDGAFGDQTTGALARKCVEVAPRAVHTLGSGGVALLYERPPTEYLEYCDELYGERARVLALRPNGYRDFTRPLSLLKQALDDPELLRAVSATGIDRGLCLDPFYPHPDVFELARRTRLPVAGMSEAAVRAGVAVQLNAKKEFQEVCRQLGIPVPPSEYGRGVETVLRLAEKHWTRHHAVMLRQSHGAGGLGNLRITELDLESAGKRNLFDFLAPVFADPHWTRDDILVEEYFSEGNHRVVATPTVLMWNHEGASHHVATISSRRRNDAFIGGIIPADLPTEVTDKLVDMSWRYCRYAAEAGCTEGFIDLDFGLLASGEILAWESNCRYGGNNHPVAMRRRLAPWNAGGLVSWSNDALKVGARISFNQALAAVRERGIAWSKKRGEGAVISIPPASGSMGYVVLARTHRRAAELSEIMEDFAASTLV
jgi:hypothetical protein